MSIVLNDPFTTGTSQNIGAYNADYARWLGTTEQLTVDATDDRVESSTTGEFGFLWQGTGSPTEDYEVRGTGFTNRAGEGPALQVRCSAASGGNGYWVTFLAGAPPDIYRYDNGAFNYLQSLTAAGNVPNGTAFSMRVRVTTDGSNNVVIQAQINSGTTANYTDTAANRKLSGNPGLTIYKTGGAADDIWLDDYIVDNLATTVTDTVGIRATLVAAFDTYHPASTMTAGSWTVTGAASLHAAIDEPDPAADGDYIQSAASPSNDMCEVALESVPVPGAGTVDIVIRSRVR